MQENEKNIVSQAGTVENEEINSSLSETVAQNSTKQTDDAAAMQAKYAERDFSTGKAAWPETATEKEDYSDFMYRPETEAKMYEIYRHREMNYSMERDLRRIQSIDPTVADLADLPDEYIAFRFNKAMPLDAVSAYKAMQAVISGRKPPSTGAMTGSATSEKEFYTSEELDRLTKADLDDPAVMAKAMRSMALLK